MEYLTVKDVAALVRRNEETIRRMIRARKLDVTLVGNNRRQGYMIPVDQLIRNWDISPEEVERYLKKRRARAETPARMPLGPERPDADARTEAADELVRSVLRRSEQLITREMSRVAALAGGGNTESGDESDMSGDRNKWVNIDGHAEESQYQQDSGAEQRRAEPDAGQRAWHIDENLSADIAAAGERVSEIIGDAYRQIRSALDQAGVSGQAARDRAGASVQTAFDKAGTSVQTAFDKAGTSVQTAFDKAGTSVQTAFDKAGASVQTARGQSASGSGRATPDTSARRGAGECDTAERARRERERNQAAIRQSIDRAQARTASAPAAQAAPAHGTGGWADNIRPLRNAQPVQPAQPQEPAQTAWSETEPTPAPELRHFHSEELDFDVPEVTREGLDGEDNASYRLLREARRAVEERMRAAQQAQAAAADVVDAEAVEAVEFATAAQDAPARDAEPAGEAEPAEVIESIWEDEPAGASGPVAEQPAEMTEPVAEQPTVGTEPVAEQPTVAAEPVVEQPAGVVETEHPAATVEPVAEQPVPQLPTRDEDAMQRRIEELEAQLSRMGGQLERLTRRLLGEDEEK